MRPRVIAAVAAILFVIASVWAGLPAHATVHDDPLSGFTQAERGICSSPGQPAILTVDPATGEFVAIDAATSLVQPFGVVPNCSGDRACWQGYLSPHLWYGFDGTGASGTWANRGNFKSRKTIERSSAGPTQATIPACLDTASSTRQSPSGLK